MGVFPTKQERIDKRAWKALNSRNLDKLRAAFDEGASMNPTGYHPWTYNAANGGFYEGLLFLKERGCDVSAAGPYGRTPLHIAITYGYMKIAAWLVENGADINAADRDGRSPLHMAAKNGKMDRINLLIAAGADLSLRDGEMNTAADLAREKYPRIAEYLLQKMSPEAAPVPEDAAGEGWHRTGEDEIAHIAKKPEIGYCITDIFNFRARLHTRINRNLETGAESCAIKTFDELSGSPMIEDAADALRSRGGQAGETCMLAKQKFQPGSPLRGG